MSRVQVTVVSSHGERNLLSWYEGTTSSAIAACVKLAFGLPAEATARLITTAGTCLLADDGGCCDPGATLNLEVSLPEGALFHDRTSSSDSPPRPRLGEPWPVEPMKQREQHSCTTEEEADELPVADESAPLLGKGAPSAALPGGGGGRRRGGSKGKDYSVADRGGGGGGGDWGGDGDGDVDHRTWVCWSPTGRRRWWRRWWLRQQQPSSFFSLSSSSSPAEDALVPEEAQQAWLKLKRVLAHLANERTFLAWVRVASKLFATGVMCLNLASSGQSWGGWYVPSCVTVGGAHLLACPAVVGVGFARFEEAGACMMGSARKAFAYFRGRHLFTVTVALGGLTCLMCALMAVEVGAWGYS